MDFFTSTKNKEILWDVLNNHNVFKNIKNIHIDNVRQLFHQIINDVSVNFNHLSLIEKNKKVLDIFTHNINIIVNSNENNILNRMDNNPDQRDIESTNLNANNNLTQFEKAKLDFEQYNSPKPPKEIDFSDDVYDEPLGDKMNILLEQQQKQREMDLNQIFIPKTDNSGNFNTLKDMSDNNVDISNITSQLHQIDNIRENFNIIIQNNINIEKKISDIYDILIELKNKN